MHITITKPRLSDAPLMAKWGKENAALRDCEDDQWYSPRLLRQWIAHPAEDTILVARDGRKLVGMCLVHGMRGWAYFSSLYVVKEYRSKGVGTALLTKMQEALKKQKHCECSLLVKEADTDIQKFYHKQGFKKGYLFRWMGKEL